MITFEAAKGAKPKAFRLLSGKFPEVTGVGVTRVPDGWALKVNLSAPTRRQLPNDVDGVPVISEIIGDVVAQ